MHVPLLPEQLLQPASPASLLPELPFGQPPVQPCMTAGLHKLNAMLTTSVLYASRPGEHARLISSAGTVQARRPGQQHSSAHHQASLM